MLCHTSLCILLLQVTQLRKPVSVEERVAVTIWKLATNIEYRTLASLFGLGRSTVGKIIVETNHAISTHLLPQYVKIPDGDKLKDIVKGFETCWGFPQAAGAIDGSHIPIIRPDESASDYYNRKGYYSVIMQAMVDFRGLFMDVYIGWPGKVHDQWRSQEMFNGRACIEQWFLCAQSAPARGVWGHAPPENFSILGLLRLYLVHPR